MKTLSELLSSDDETLAQGVYDGFSSDTPLEQDLEFTGIFQQLILFPSFIACDGFDSIFYQIVFPPEWPAYEGLLQTVGAQHYASLLRRGRQLYFGGDYLPATNQEWSDFRSPVWEHPHSDAARELDQVAKEAEEAYYSDAVARKLGSYIRSNWDALFKSKSERA